MRKSIAFAFALVIFALPAYSATTSVKSGSTCKNLGSIAISSGKKFSCIKIGKKLVWDKGTRVISPSPRPTPTPAQTAKPEPNQTPTSSPSTQVTVEKKFIPWSKDVNSKIVNDAAQDNFQKWLIKNQNANLNHKLIMQDGMFKNRARNFREVDTLGSRLFSNMLTQNSVTVIGTDEKWVVKQLNEQGANTTNCNENAGNSGLNYCVIWPRYLGMVATADEIYSSTYPGRDGTALLAHEYFHLIQDGLIGLQGLPIMDGTPETSKGFPAWFVEGSADFVGFSVAYTAMNAKYWDGYQTMFEYAPKGESINKNALADYEIRNGPGNDSPTYPYIVGRIAIEYLVASNGFDDVIEILKDFQTSKNFNSSFQKVVGKSKESFYQLFDEIRTNLSLPPITWKLNCLTNSKISDSSGNKTPCTIQRPTNSTPTTNSTPITDTSGNIGGQPCAKLNEIVRNSFGEFWCLNLNGGLQWSKNNN